MQASPGETGRPLPTGAEMGEDENIRARINKCSRTYHVRHGRQRRLHIHVVAQDGKNSPDILRRIRIRRKKVGQNNRTGARPRGQLRRKRLQIRVVRLNVGLSTLLLGRLERLSARAIGAQTLLLESVCHCITNRRVQIGLCRQHKVFDVLTTAVVLKRLLHKVGGQIARYSSAI